MISPARTSALQILLRYQRDGMLLPSQSDREENRRLADQIACGVIQNGRYLDAVLTRFVRNGLQNLHPVVREILRLSAYQILFLDRVPDFAAVNDAASLCRANRCGFAAGFVNAVLRNVSRGKGSFSEMNPAVRYSHPDWIVDRLARDFGQSFTEAFLAANQVVPDLRLQVHTGRCSLEEFIAMLREEGREILDINPFLSSVMIKRCDYFTIDARSTRMCYVQDDAARMSVDVCGLKPGMRVLDVCAAPGGKSIAAGLYGAEVLCCDLSPQRLERCLENFTRLKLDIPIRQQDATVFCPEWSESFDCVIADVPCTGTGVIRKHPEIRDKEEKELLALLPIQQAVLQNVSRYVAPGGLLLYATCSVLREEDEDQILRFLNTVDGFDSEPIDRPGFSCENGMLRSWPQLNGNDGFFAAALRKRK